MATLEQIQAKLNKLQAQADALLARKAQAAVDQIRKLMLEHGLTTEDIEAKAKAKRAAKGLNVSAAVGPTSATAGVKAKAAPKYQHPKTGATWTGHGRAPAWIAEAKDRNKLLIASGDEAAGAVDMGGASKMKAVDKTASKSVGAAAGKGQRTGRRIRSSMSSDVEAQQQDLVVLLKSVSNPARGSPEPLIVAKERRVIASHRVAEADFEQFGPFDDEASPRCSPRPAFSDAHPVCAGAAVARSRIFAHPSVLCA